MQELIYKIVNRLYRGLAKCVPHYLSDVYQHFNRYMFLTNEMKKDFPWRKYAKVMSPYYKKWGFDIPMVDAEYYSLVSGIKSDRYVTRSMAMFYIYPYLDRYEFYHAYMDKNVQKQLLGLDDAGKQIDVMGTEDIVYNSNGVFYNGKRGIVSREEAIELLLAYGCDMILKPSVETFGGHGVMRVAAGVSREELEALMAKYHYNFTFQKLIEQHPVLQACNPTSVNTIRIVTYRAPSKQLKVLYSCLRFGGAGAINDNVCTGGGYTGVNIEDGRLRDRKRYSYFTTQAPLLPETFPDKVPAWYKVKEAALFLHDRLPHFDIVGWDFSVTPEGKPLFVEYNLRPGVGLQQAVGPMFSDEDLDELMSHVSKYTLECKPLGVMRFKDLPGRTTIHYNKYILKNC